MPNRISTAVLTLSLAIAPASVNAQQFTADIRIYQGPVAAHVVLDPAGYVVRRPVPVRAVVVPVGPQVVVVERVRGPHGHAYGYWRHRGYREVTLYYDPRTDRYYDAPYGYPGFHPVIAYEREGTYCLPEGGRNDDD